MIVASRREAVRRAQLDVPEGVLRERLEVVPPARDFPCALRRVPGGAPRIIAELKKASPSKGLIRPEFRPRELAADLAGSGAAALSVLTEPAYFQGSPEFLRVAVDTVAIPILRKDFMVAEYQLLEARAWGAAAVLLIAAALSGAEYGRLYRAARGLGLHVLTEVHDRKELEVVLDEGVQVVGVNSRDLRTFEVDLGITAELIAHVPPDVVRVAESGVRSAEDIRFLEDAGADAFLIGETLMREPAPGAKLGSLLREARRG